MVIVILCVGRLVAAWPLLETATIGQSDQHQHHPPPPGIFTPSHSSHPTNTFLCMSYCASSQSVLSDKYLSNISLHHLDSLSGGGAGVYRLLHSPESTSQFYSEIMKTEYFLLKGWIIVLNLISNSKSQRGR